MGNLQAAGLLYAYMWLFVIGSGAWMTLTTLTAGLSLAQISLGFGPTIKSTKGQIAVKIRLIPMGSYVTQPENEAGDAKPFPTGIRLACHAGNMAIPAVVVLLAIGATQGVSLLESVALNFIPITFSPLDMAPAATEVLGDPQERADFCVGSDGRRPLFPRNHQFDRGHHRIS